VPDGEYYLIAQNEYETPEASSLPVKITVKDNDVAGIELNIVRSSSLSGKVIIEAANQETKSLCKDGRQRSIEEILVSALRDSQANPSYLPAWLFESHYFSNPDEQGNFKIMSIASGKYHLRAFPLDESLYVRAIRSRPATKPTKGQMQISDIAQNGISLKPGEEVKEIAITVARGAAKLHGKISPAQATAALPD